MYRQSRFLLTLTASLLAWLSLMFAGALRAQDSTPLSGGWNIASSGTAGTSGELLFRLTPADGGVATEVTVFVLSGTNETGVASSIRRALSTQLNAARYDVEAGEGANVLVTPDRPDDRFALQLVSTRTSRTCGSSCRARRRLRRRPCRRRTFRQIHRPCRHLQRLARRAPIRRRRDLRSPRSPRLNRRLRPPCRLRRRPSRPRLRRSPRRRRPNRHPLPPRHPRHRIQLPMPAAERALLRARRHRRPAPDPATFCPASRYIRVSTRAALH
jgi:hypothetical protein